MAWRVFRKHAPQITCWQLGRVTACGLVCIQEACIEHDITSIQEKCVTGEKLGGVGKAHEIPSSL